MITQLNLISAILLSALFFGSAACKKADYGPQLPPETHLGKNTFGCKVDGKIWLPKTDDFLYHTIGSEYQIKKKKFVIGAGISTDISQGMTLEVNNFSEVPKEYALQDPYNPFSSDSAWARFRIRVPSPEKAFFTSNLKQGKLIIVKIDTIERIATGRFEFEGTDNGSGETVKVTEGRFDVRYNRFK